MKPSTPLATAKTLTATLLLGGLLGHALPSPAVTVTPEELTRRVKAHVREALNVHFGRTLKADEVKIDVVKVPGITLDFPEAASVDELQVELASSLDKAYSNRGVVRARITGPDGQVRAVGVPVKISIFKPVWVVDNPIPAGKSLNPRDCHIVRKEISQTALTTLAADKDLSTYEARINLQPGEVLDVRKVHNPPAIRRHATVRILMSNGQGVNISVQGQALTDGQIGETIRVRQRLNNDVSRTRYYTAKVISKNQVLVEL
jgi:flagella basal body P-ring formation protein FlgA